MYFPRQHRNLKLDSKFKYLNSVLKVRLSPSKKVCFNRRPLKKMKNVFYFMLKTLSALKIFKFLSCLFWSSRKSVRKRKLKLSLMRKLS